MRCVHLAWQYIALPRPWLPLQMKSSASRDLHPPEPQMWGSSGLSSLVYVLWPGLCGGGGGVVGWEEGVGAVDQPGVDWCVVVGGGEGVVPIVHEGHVRGWGWLLVVGAGDVARDVVPEVAKGGHTVNPRPSSPVHYVGWGGARWGLGNVGLVVATAALGGHLPRLGISDKLSPPVDGGHPETVPFGGRLSPSGVASGGRSCRAKWMKASKRKSREPSLRVVAWTRGASQMRWVVPEVWRRR